MSHFLECQIMKNVTKIIVLMHMTKNASKKHFENWFYSDSCVLLIGIRKCMVWSLVQINSEQSLQSKNKKYMYLKIQVLKIRRHIREKEFYIPKQVSEMEKRFPHFKCEFSETELALFTTHYINLDQKLYLYFFCKTMFIYNFANTFK